LVQCSFMTMRVRIQLLAPAHCCSISTRSCFTTLTTALSHLSDYHLFTYLKNWLWSQRFNNNEELMEGVKTWLSSQAADFFDTGMQNLIPRVGISYIIIFFSFIFLLTAHVKLLF
jgi:hypothetical protein